MIALMVAALAVQTVPAQSFAKKPAPVNSPQTWVTNDDYPAEALRDDQQGTVGFVLEVDTQGMVSTCEITASSGSPVLDTATCTLLTARARFRPATDDTGKPIFSRWPSRFTWTMPAPKPWEMESWVQTVRFELDAHDGIAKCERRRLGAVPEDFESCPEAVPPPEVAAIMREHSGGATAYEMVTTHHVAGTPMPGGYTVPEGLALINTEIRMRIGADGKVRSCDPAFSSVLVERVDPSELCEESFLYTPDPRGGDERQVTMRNTLIAHPPAKP